MTLFLCSTLFLSLSSCSDDDNAGAGEPIEIKVVAGTFSEYIEIKGLLKSNNLVLSGEMNINDFVA